MNLRSMGMTRKDMLSHHNQWLWVSEAKYACQVQKKVRVMSTVFFDHKGFIHHEYAPDGQTVNKVYYVKVLCWLRDVAWHKQPASWKRGDWQLPHDNVPTHLSHLVQNSWLNIRSHKCRILPLHFTWPNVIVFYSRRWKCCWRGIGFKTQRR